MRWNLMETFNEIYVLDLHGNANKKEVSPVGTKDENVFDIEQGVAIMFAIKTRVNKNNGCKVFHLDLWGKREYKYDYLERSSIETLKWKTLEPRLPYLLYVPENISIDEVEYKNGFAVDEIFIKNTSGIVTMGDSFIIAEKLDELQKRVSDFLNDDISESGLTSK